MPTIDDDFSDPEDLPLDAAPIPPLSSAPQFPPQAPQAGLPNGIAFTGPQGFKEVPAELYKGCVLSPLCIVAQ